MKSYFCKNCGRDYKLIESLRNGYSLYCFKCPSKRLHIAGWPLIMVGVSLLVLFLVHRKIFPETQGRQFLFLPAAFGIILVGFLRLWQAHHQRKKWKILAYLKKNDEAEKTAIIHPKTSHKSDPEKWDSDPASPPATNTPDKVEV